MKLIGSWAASGPQEAPAKTTNPLIARAPARDEPPRLPTSAMIAGTIVATPSAKITLAMTSAHRAAAEMASAASPAAAIRNPTTATRVAP